MRIVDTSVLLPAVSPSLPQHEAAKRALEAAINDDRPVGLVWVVVNAFLRLTTKPGLLENPLRVTEAWIAAIALGHGASVLTLDSDFARFPDVRWESPLAK